ncbi:MAG: transcription-repair coupling factor, partial [Candidatus Limnocylindrales bacterium]
MMPTLRLDHHARLARLSALVATEPTIAEALADRADGLRTLDLQAPEPLRPFLTHALAQQSTVLAVTATAREGEDLVAQLSELLGGDAVSYFPAWETLPHERLSPRSDTVGRRLAVLRRLVHPTAAGDLDSDTATGPLQVIVAPVRSLLQPQVKGLADLAPVELHKGDDTELHQVVRDLAAAAYSRVDLVERRGEFAVRGGIIDVFPPTEDHPLRIEFWGDTVEEIRRFAVADQRTLEEVTHVWAPPCRELLLDDDVRARAAELALKHPRLAEIFTKLSEGHAVEGM